jgi:hypothetical protein
MSEARRAELERPLNEVSLVPVRVTKSGRVELA